MAEQKRSSTGLIAAAWLLVSIPTAWGVYNTALNAVKLFTAPSAAPVSAPAAPASTPAQGGPVR